MRTPARAPRANAITERFLRSVRRECLDHPLLLGEAHLQRTLGSYVANFNAAQSHQGLSQRVPVQRAAPGSTQPDAGDIVALPVLGELHHTYQRRAIRHARATPFGSGGSNGRIVAHRSPVTGPCALGPGDRAATVPRP